MKNLLMHIIGILTNRRWDENWQCFVGDDTWVRLSADMDREIARQERELELLDKPPIKYVAPPKPVTVSQGVELYSASGDRIQEEISYQGYNHTISGPMYMSCASGPVHFSGYTYR
jgi:hypothetical protein